MDSQVLTAEIRENHQALKFRFIMIELELAATFGDLARCTGSEKAAKRNIVNACRAYAAAENARQGYEFNTEIADEIEQRARYVQELVENLSLPHRR